MAFLRQEASPGEPLSDEALAACARSLSVRFVEAGFELIRQGELQAELHLIFSGLIQLESEGDDLPRRRVGWLGRGRWVGVMAAVSGEPASATATARRDTILLSLSAAALEEALAAEPRGALRLARFTQRCEGAPLAQRPGGDVVTAVVEPAAELERFVEEPFRRAVGEQEEGYLLTRREVEERFGAGVVSEPPDWRARVQLVTWLEEQVAAHQCLVLLNDPKRRLWQRCCGRQADRFWMFHALAEEDPATGVQQRVFHPTDPRQKQLIIVNIDPGPISPKLLESWTRPRQLGQVHVVSSTDDEQARRLADQLFQERLSVATLRQIAPFSGLPDGVLDRLREVGSIVDVNGGQVLIEAGGRQDSVYVVSQGRFEVISPPERGGAVLATCGPGVFLGELNAIEGGGARTATVRALRDGRVIHLAGADFRELIQAFPQFAHAVMKRVARTATALPGRVVRSRITNIAVLPLTDTGRERGFAEALAAAAATYGPSTVLSGEDLDRALGPGASSIGRGQPGDGQVLAWLHRLEEDHTTVVYRCAPAVTPWTRRALRQADRIVMVADASASPERRPIEARLFDDPTQPLLSPRHLVLIQAPEATEGSGTLDWLLPREGWDHHHVRHEREDDLGAAFRRLTQRAIGVAFSGASTRGPAHLGVVRLLREHGIPIDVVAGSSSGAGVAGLVALRLPVEETFRRGYLANSPQLRGTAQPPFTALYRTNGLAYILEHMLGEHCMEDLFIPCVLTAMDINHHQAVQLKRGSLRRMVQASCSLPVVWSPLWNGEQLLVDGGIISYLPLDTLTEVCAQGTAIASDLDPDAGKEVAAFDSCERYGPELSGWSILLEKLNPFAPKRNYPSLSDIMFHSICFPSFQHQRHLRELEGQPGFYFVRPPLDAFGIFDVNEEVARELEAKTYAHAREVLAPLLAEYANQEGGGSADG